MIRKKVWLLKLVQFLALGVSAQGCTFGDTDNTGCVPMTCNAQGIWVPDSQHHNRDCNYCKAYNDPHFVNFNGNIFDWHIGCNHALVQDGNTYNPDFGVFMDFDRQGTIANVGPTTYKDDPDTQVKLIPGAHSVTVEKDSWDTTLFLTDVPIHLFDRVPSNKIPVWGWMTTSPPCIVLYGTQTKIRVELCPEIIQIWAPVPSYPSTLGGLCGRTKGVRPGELYTRPPVLPAWSIAPTTFGSLPNVNFGYSWQALSQTKAVCPAIPPGQGGPGRRKRDVKETQAEKLRTECMDFHENPYKANCSAVYDDSGITEPTQGQLYDSCLFDLCIVANDTEAPFTVEEMLQQHQNISKIIKRYEDNSIDLGPGRKWPYCENSGQLGGQCLYPADLLNENCDFIINETIHDDVICGSEQYCCIDCNTQTLNETCHDEAGNDTASRRICCPGEFDRGLLKGGCRCCGHCTPTRWCRRHGGFCVSKYDEVYNFWNCRHELGGRVYRSKRKGCKGKNCGCCILLRK